MSAYVLHKLKNKGTTDIHFTYVALSETTFFFNYPPDPLVIGFIKENTQIYASCDDRRHIRRNK